MQNYTKLCVNYFEGIKTKNATYLKRIVQEENHVNNLGYLFQDSSTLGFNVFEIIHATFAHRVL